MSSLTEKQSAISSERAIANLMALYAYRNDDADIAGLGELYAEAVFTLDGTAARGRDEIEARARGIIQVREDGRSATTHEITNIMIDVDEEMGTAVGRAYWTLYQTVSGKPRVAILSGRYLDRFERRHGEWRFTERTATSLWQLAA
jgi:ketosteroid isomerase-like protein